MQFFATHPLTRTLILLAYGALSVAIKHDYNDFKASQKEDPKLRFKLTTALQKWGWGLVTAVVASVGPTVLAEVTKILGGGVLPTP